MFKIGFKGFLLLKEPGITWTTL